MQNIELYSLVEPFMVKTTFSRPLLVADSQAITTDDKTDRQERTIDCW